MVFCEHEKFTKSGAPPSVAQSVWADKAVWALRHSLPPSVMFLPAIDGHCQSKRCCFTFRIISVEPDKWYSNFGLQLLQVVDLR